MANIIDLVNWNSARTDPAATYSLAIPVTVPAAASTTVPTVIPAEVPLAVVISYQANTPPVTASLRVRAEVQATVQALGQNSQAAPNPESPGNTSGHAIPEPPGSDPSSSISTGAIAGAAVGAFAGGLLVGLLIALLAFWRKRRNQKRDVSSQASIETHNEVVRPKERGPINKHLQADSSLLDATSDREMAEAYRNIHKLLLQHMDNFYHRQPVDVDVTTLKRAAQGLELVHDDALDLDTIMSLALDPRTRAAVLHHIIAQVLVKCIDFNSPGNLSMLPPHLTGLVRSFPAAEHGGGNSDAFGDSLHQWRTLTAYLMQPHRSHRLPLAPSEESLKPQIDVLISALMEFLGPFVAVDEVSQTKQRSHLQAITFECAKFGYLLLSQPREWQFLYRNASQSRDTEPCLSTTRSEDSMDGPVRSSGAMVKTSRFFSAVVEFDKVPDDIQSCLELVRTCHTNVQKLITKRNDHIELLTRRPNDLAHVNSVIEAALGSLQDVAVIVERSRPQTTGGRTTLAKRFRWTYSDKESFRKHLPLVNQHHNAVSSELAYLGQLGSAMSSAGAPERNPSFGRVENRRTFQDMGLLVDLMGGLSLPREGLQVGNSTSYATATTSFQTASITTTPSHPISRDITAPPPSYEQSTSDIGASSDVVAPLQPPPSPRELSSNSDHVGNNAWPQKPETPNNTSIDASGLSMMLSDYAPLPERNTSVTIQNTVFNAPVNLVVNVNSASGESSAAQIAEDTRAAVQLSLRDLLGSGGMNMGSHSSMESSSHMKPGIKEPGILKEIVTVSETRGSHLGKEFVMRSGTTKSYVGKEVVMGPGTNGSGNGKEVLMASTTDNLHLGMEVVMGSMVDQSRLGKENNPYGNPANTSLPSPPPLPPKTPLSSLAAPAAVSSQGRMLSPPGLSYHAELNPYELNKGPPGNVFELPAEPRRC
ncbi:hypothetical protein PG985_014775 [Apiospora marii]|uniref:uncharacterized protein n=1 Tax=Apiospora marii TaxID=335849 RepID=UPI00312FFA27